MGESLSTAQKFDTPIEQATTSSLEALQAYSLGRKSVSDNDYAAAVPLLERAIRLDPNFAMAYASLGLCYGTLGETTFGSENTKKAYELRERVNEREKFYIESHYYQHVIGDMEKARQAYELYAQVYPRDSVPPANLADIYHGFGQHDKALEQARKMHRLQGGILSYVILVNAYINLNRVEEARATAREAQAKKLDSPGLHFDLYRIAFLQNDAAGMKEQVDRAAGKQEEHLMLAAQGDTAAYSGQLGMAREFSRRAIALAERAENKEGAAGLEAGMAWREANFGNAAEARQRVAAALALSTGRDVQCTAANVLAIVGDAARAQALADDLAKRFPEDTEVQFDCLPTLHAQLALSRGDSTKSVELLQVAAPTELGLGGLWPAFVRGNAYLAMHQGTEAAAEFQKILDHRGIAFNDFIGALAHLKIGRAYAMQGDTAKAKAAYQDFLTLWKDADPDIPIFMAAKAEYAKLQ